MVSRRRALQLVAGGLAGVAGCLGGESRQSTSTTARTTTTSSTTTSTTTTTEATGTTTDTDETTGLPEWRPAWHQSAAATNVVGVDATDDAVYATATDNRAAAAVEAFDPASGSRRWRARLDGEAVAGSATDHGGWGVTVGDDRVYAVTGVVDPDDGWTTLHALDAASGEQVWTRRSERRFEVVGVADGAVYVLAHEFEPEVGPEREPPPQPATLHALDAAGGVRWSHRLDRADSGRVHRGTVHVVAGSEVVAFAPDGTVRWRFVADAEVRRVLPAGDRLAVIVPGDGDRSTVHGLAPDGTAAWSRTVSGDEWVGDGRRLYAVGRGVSALDPDGSVAWRDNARAIDLVLGSIGDALYVRAGRAADAVGAYGAADGTRRWTFDPDSKNAWPAAATADVAVAVAMTNTESAPSTDTLYAVDADDGRPTASFTLDTAFDVEAFDGRVFVGSGRTDVYAFEA